jgi:translation initiation factor 1 (eIF-1/SUI1)
MDPFFSMETTNFMADAAALINKKKITIMGASRGRKADTYIVNWDISEDELKTHLKTMKQDFGCNGSIKMVEYEGKQVKGLHLQGDKISKVEAYLIKKNIKDLEVKKIL